MTDPTPTSWFCLQPLAAQVGGHVKIKMLNSHFICKPYNQREHKFYQLIPAELRRCVPRYVGTLGVERKESEKYIVLENLTAGLNKACVLDLKMGTRMYSDSASQSKIESQKRKSLKTTSATLGVRFCGFQKYCNQRNIFERLDKYVGRDADNLEFRNLVKHFFSRREVLRRDVIQCVLDEILYITHVLSNLDQMRLYSSSLLIIYEGLEKEKGGSVESESLYSLDRDDDDKPVVKVKIIDFANAALPEDDQVHHGPDQGFLLGLHNLQHILKHLLSVQEDIF